MMTKLLDALKQRFRTPQEAVKALGLDEALLDEIKDDPAPVIAHDDAIKPPWTDHRFTFAMAQDALADVEPIKPNGRKEMLLAAARRARAQGREDVARRADAIRMREFPEAGDEGNQQTDYMSQYEQNQAAPRPQELPTEQLGPGNKDYMSEYENNQNRSP